MKKTNKIKGAAKTAKLNETKKAKVERTKVFKFAKRNFREDEMNPKRPLRVDIRIDDVTSSELNSMLGFFSKALKRKVYLYELLDWFAMPAIRVAIHAKKELMEKMIADGIKAYNKKRAKGGVK